MGTHVKNASPQWHKSIYKKKKIIKAYYKNKERIMQIDWKKNILKQFRVNDFNVFIHIKKSFDFTLILSKEFITKF